MKKIIIIGNSIAGVKAIEEIRSRDKESEITLFLEDSHLPAHNYLFGDFLMKAITEDKIFYKPGEFYKENNVHIISGKKIGRVDFKKNRVVTLEKEQFPFDALLITDTSNHRFPEIKGTAKMGVFGLKRLSDIKDILAILHLVDCAVIQADSIEGLKIACSLKKRVKEVILIIPSSHVLFSLLDKGPAEVIEKCLEQNAIRIVKENAVSEILGEGEVKAVRLKTGKVLASQMAVIADTKTDLRYFSESSLKMNQGILVDDFFQTNIPNVFAAGGACEMPAQGICNFSADPFSLREQGRVAGLNMSGQATAYQEPLRFLSFDLLGVPVVFIGKTKRQEGFRELTHIDAEKNIYRKIFLKDGRLAGALLINDSQDRDKILNLIREKTDISNLSPALEGFALSEEKPPETSDATVGANAPSGTQGANESP